MKKGKVESNSTKFIVSGLFLFSIALFIFALSVTDFGHNNLSITGNVVQLEANFTYFQGTNYQWGFAGASALSGDYDGDGKSDLAVYYSNATSGYWFIKKFPTGPILSWYLRWGNPGMIPVSGDYDGDGKSDLALWNPTDGKWYIAKLTDGQLGNAIIFGTQWGSNGMTPVSGDYDGDGKDDLGLWNPTDGKWYVYSVAKSQSIVWAVAWGSNGMTPVSGDYDGDGKSDLALWNPTDGKWYIRDSANTKNILWAKQYGSKGMIPVSGDYDGDGVYDLAFYGYSVPQWWIYSVAKQENILWNKGWGSNVFTPVSGDFSGDGIYDIVLYNGANAGGQWEVYPLYIPATVAPAVVDTTAPVMSGLLPTGNRNHTTVTLRLITNENAICGYSLQPFTCANLVADNSRLFTNTNALVHNSTVTLQDNRAYTYYVRCVDAAGNCNPTASNIIFTINTSSSQVACVDSDGGLNYNVVGNATNSLGGLSYDICAPLAAPVSEQRWVNEQYCTPSGGIDFETYECPNGCLNGACIAEENNTGVVNTTANAYFQINSSIGSWILRIILRYDADFREDLVTLRNESGDEVCMDMSTGDTCTIEGFVLTFTEVNYTTRTVRITVNTPGYILIYPIESSATCTDSDGGLNYFVKGNVTNELGIDVGNDFCRSGDYDPLVSDRAFEVSLCSEGDCQLVETYCLPSNIGNWLSYTCANGCSNGACLPGCAADETWNGIACVNASQQQSCTSDGCIDAYDNCLVEGFRVSVGGVRYYCESTNFSVQREVNATCVEDYECESNLCGGGVCLSLGTEIQRQTGLLAAISCWFQRLLGIDNPSC